MIIKYFLCQHCVSSYRYYNFYLAQMSEKDPLQCDLLLPGSESSRFACEKIFDLSKIARDGRYYLKEKPLPTARLLIRRGISAIKDKIPRVARIWRILTGFDDWRQNTLPELSEEECEASEYMIYVILDLKRYRTLYVGQTIQRLDKRISDHIRNM